VKRLEASVWIVGARWCKSGRLRKEVKRDKGQQIQNGRSKDLFADDAKEFVCSNGKMG
jgi:hypothetical protein